MTVYYRIAGNFRGTKFSWISWFRAGARKFHPRMLEPRPFIKYVQTATVKILPRNHSCTETHENFSPRKLPAIQCRTWCLRFLTCTLLYPLNTREYTCILLKVAWLKLLHVFFLTVFFYSDVTTLCLAHSRTAGHKMYTNVQTLPY